MGVAEGIAGQLRRPSGVAGRAMAQVLNRGNRRINAGSVRRLELASTDDVLEVGFGGGAALAAILARTEGLVAGIEISEPMLRRARRRFRRELDAGRLELRRAGVSEIPYEAERFDRALSVQTIYFWPDPIAGLREIHRVLRPGGRILIATATKEAIERRSRITRHGFRKLDEGDLEALLRQAGFAEVGVERDDPRLFTSGMRRRGDGERAAMPQ